MSLFCWRFRPRLGAYRDGELDGAVRTATETHLARCAGCTAELAGLGRLRAALALDVAEPPDAVWDAFWPQVRARMAMPEAASTPRRPWAPILAYPRLVIGSAVALAAAAILTLTNLSSPPETPQPATLASSAMSLATPAVTPVTPVVFHSVETAPDSSAIVFTNPEADIVWVFGLEPTGPPS